MGKQESKYYEHFYSELQAQIDFLPIDHNLSNLTSQIAWARQNPAEVQKMIKSANEKVAKALEPAELFCYWLAVLENISKISTGEVTVPDHMEHIQDKQTNKECFCDSVRDEL